MKSNEEALRKAYLEAARSIEDCTDPCGIITHEYPYGRWETCSNLALIKEYEATHPKSLWWESMDFPVDNLDEHRCGSRMHGKPACGKPATNQGISTAWFCDECWAELQRIIRNVEAT